MEMRTRSRWAAAVSAGVLLGGSFTVASGAAVPSPAAVGRPLAPTDLTASVSTTGVVLHWRAPRVTAHHGAATDYLVVWTAPPIEPLQAVADTHSSATMYLSHFGSGTYQVVAKDAAGSGPASAPVQVGS